MVNDADGEDGGGADKDESCGESVESVGEINGIDGRDEPDWNGEHGEPAEV